MFCIAVIKAQLLYPRSTMEWVALSEQELRASQLEKSVFQNDLSSFLYMLLAQGSFSLREKPALKLG